MGEMGENHCTLEEATFLSLTVHSRGGLGSIRPTDASSSIGTGLDLSPLLLLAPTSCPVFPIWSRRSAPPLRLAWKFAPTPSTQFLSQLVKSSSLDQTSLTPRSFQWTKKTSRSRHWDESGACNLRSHGLHVAAGQHKVCRESCGLQGRRRHLHILP